MTNYKAVKRIIERVVRTQIDDVEIVSIDVTPDEDFDGDRILRIQVVFNADEKRLDAGKTSALARHVIRELHENGSQIVEESDFQDAFPVFSFIADSEVKRGKAGPA